jgi:hypothetical protein
MFKEEIFEIVQPLLERELTPEERRFLIFIHQEAKPPGSYVGPVSVSRETSPISATKAARHSGSVLVLAACTLLALGTWYSPLAAQENADPAQRKPSESLTVPDEHQRVLLPAGTVISVRIADRVDSNRLHTGDLLTGIVDPSFIYDDRVLIPRGTEAHIRMVEDKKGGHLHGKAEVELGLISLVMNGRQMEVESDDYHKQQGVLAAKVKAAAPASAGAGANMATGTDPGSAASPVIAIFHAAKVDLPPDTRVKFTLTAPLTFDKPSTGSPSTTSGK